MCIAFDPAQRPGALHLLKHGFFDSLRADASACSSPTLAWSIMARSFSPVVSYSNLSVLTRGRARSSCSEAAFGGLGSSPGTPGAHRTHHRTAGISGLGDAASRLYEEGDEGTDEGEDGPGEDGSCCGDSGDGSEEEEEEGEGMDGLGAARRSKGVLRRAMKRHGVRSHLRAQTVCLAALKDMPTEREEVGGVWTAVLLWVACLTKP
jgi:hypothetical protein